MGGEGPGLARIPGVRDVVRALVLVVGICAGAAPGASDLEDVLGGFEDDAAAPEASGEPGESAPAGPSRRWWELTGSTDLTTSINYLAHRSTTGTDYTGLSMLRTRLELQLDIDLPRRWEVRLGGVGFYDFAYLANGRGRYTDDVLDDYEWWADTKDMWIQGSPLDDLDLKLGRQIVNWGRSDSVRVLDVLNPLDNREPGLADIEFLRLPVTMVKLDYYWRDWTLTGLSIPEIRTSINPPFGSDFFPPPPILVDPGLIGLLDEDEPGASFANTQWAAAATGIFSGWDISFHFARVWEDRFHVNSDLTSLTEAALRASDLRLSRVHLLGAGGNYTRGSWLFKGELAGLQGPEYTVSSFVPLPPPAPPGTTLEVPAGSVTTSRLDGMVGVEYYGIDDLTVALEFVERHILDFQRRMKTFGAVEDQTEIALRLTGSFLNERLETTLLALVFGDPAPDASAVRLSAAYDLRDALVLQGGIVIYNGGDILAFRSIDPNDRVFFQLKYSF
jgi:hypothetical protein